MKLFFTAPATTVVELEPRDGETYDEFVDRASQELPGQLCYSCSGRYDLDAGTLEFDNMETDDGTGITDENEADFFPQEA